MTLHFSCCVSAKVTHFHIITFWINKNTDYSNQKNAGNHIWSWARLIITWLLTHTCKHKYILQRTKRQNKKNKKYSSIHQDTFYTILAMYYIKKSKLRISHVATYLLLCTWFPKHLLAVKHRINLRSQTTLFTAVVDNPREMYLITESHSQIIAARLLSKCNANICQPGNETQ